MKKYLFLLPLFMIGTCMAAESFPEFPMTLYGNVKIGSSDLKWWTLKVYNSSNKELASYDINTSGKYWSEVVFTPALVLNSFNWSLIFKVSYNWKTYVVDSIDDSKKWTWCPGKNNITFTSNKCRYDLVLKEEQTTSSSSSSAGYSWGGWHKNTSSTTSTTTTSINKTDVTSWSTTNKTQTSQNFGNIVNNKPSTLTNPEKKNETAYVSNKDTSRYVLWNQKEKLANGYSKELNNALTFAQRNNIASKTSIERANLNSKITRLSMARMLSQYAINVLWQVPNENLQPTFTDVPEWDENAKLAYQLWIMWVGTKNFRPYDTVTRAEFATSLSRMLYWTKDGWEHYYSNHLDKLKKEWVINKTDPDIKENKWNVLLMLMRTVIK